MLKHHYGTKVLKKKDKKKKKIDESKTKYLYYILKWKKAVKYTEHK